MSPEDQNLEPEIAHILSIDVVGYSKRLVNEQIELLKRLNQIVRDTPCSCAAAAGGKALRLPTGDGMVLLFFRSPEEPLQCAVQISEALQDHPDIQVRMGAHSGPVNEITDVNDRPNVAGAGLNVAQRILDCGDGGHILLSKRLADDLAEYSHWRPHLHDLGECVVKHGARVHLVNFHNGPIGNPNRPLKLQDADASADGLRKAGTKRRRYLWLAAAACLFVAAVAAAGLIFWRSNSAGAPVIPVKSVAVLPLQNLSDDPKNAFFADGVQDQIITHLNKVADLKVISSTSVMKFRDRANLDLVKIGEALGVRYFLQGNVQRSGGRVRVSVQLVDGQTSTQAWGESYDRDLADVFSIQTEVAEQIVSQLAAKFTPEEKAQIEDRPTTDLLAYDLYVRAKAMIARVALESSGLENLVEAARLLDEATARDPSFFLAYCQLASAQDQIYFYGIDPSEKRRALAQAAVDAAVRLRPDFGEAHLALAAHYYFGYRDYQRAREELAIAMRKLPNDPFPILLAGYVDRRQGRWESSTKQLKRALELGPRNLDFLKQLAHSCNALHRYDEMRDLLDRALTIAPQDPALQVQRAVIELDARADTRPLHRAIEGILKANPAAGETIADQWILLALCEGDLESANRALTRMSEKGAQEEGVPYPKAWCEGLIARMRQDPEAAAASFRAARSEVARAVESQPDFAEGLSALGMLDAALGNAEEARREGQRAVELLPTSKDAIVGPLLLQNLAVIYAWTGDKERALEALEQVTGLPSYLSYGQLLLHPSWAPLRSEKGFKKILASLAPAAR